MEDICIHGGQFCRGVWLSTSGRSCRTVPCCLCIDDVALFRNLGCGFCSKTEIKFHPQPLLTLKCYTQILYRKRDEVKGRRQVERIEEVPQVTDIVFIPFLTHLLCCPVIKVIFVFIEKVVISARVFYLTKKNHVSVMDRI